MTIGNEDLEFQVLMDKVRKYNKNADKDENKIHEAYCQCRKQHSNQHRHSGEPYYIHPYEVACILADIELDTETIIAGLLHDVIEDTEFGFEQVKNEFGEEVAMLVEARHKSDKLIKDQAINEVASQKGQKFINDVSDKAVIKASIGSILRKLEF